MPEDAGFKRRPASRPAIITFMIRYAIMAVAVAPLAAAQPTATIQKPKALTVSGGICRITEDGSTLGVNIGPNSAMPTLALTVGPRAAMADEMHANKAKFTGPGKYPNELMALYLGRTALEDSYLGLGTVTIAADGKSGAFALNDGKAAGTFDCGAPPAK
jgi:hypothetical protein